MTTNPISAMTPMIPRTIRTTKKMPIDTLGEQSRKSLGVHFGDNSQKV